jgi:hypothetical protein
MVSGLPQLMARAPQPPIVTPVPRMTPTRPVTSPAVVDLARTQPAASAAASGAAASGRNKGYPALAMQPKPQKAPPPSNSRRPGIFDV